MFCSVTRYCASSMLEPLIAQPLDVFDRQVGFDQHAIAQLRAARVPCATFASTASRCRRAARVCSPSISRTTMPWSLAPRCPALARRRHAVAVVASARCDPCSGRTPRAIARGSARQLPMRRRDATAAANDDRCRDYRESRACARAHAVHPRLLCRRNPRRSTVFVRARASQRDAVLGRDTLASPPAGSHLPDARR